MAYFNRISRISDFSTDAGGRTRVSQLNTQIDARLQYAENTNIFNTVTSSGTGTYDVETNGFNMSVTANNGYVVRETKRKAHYLSGKSNLIEITVSNFAFEVNASKIVGQYISSTTAPYNASYDGFQVVAENGNYYLRGFNNGTQVFNVASENWEYISKLSDYNWNNFTIFSFDYLWLGGSELRFFMKLDTGFELIHKIKWASNNSGTMFNNPNLPIRGEIRSTGSTTASFKFICAQVSSEGETMEFGGESTYIDSNVTSVSVINTVYPILAVRKQTGFRQRVAFLENISLVITSGGDAGNWLICKNPTLSAQPTWANVSNSILQIGTFPTNGSVTIATPNLIIAGAAMPANATYEISSPAKSSLAFLDSSVNGTEDILVLCYKPKTANATLIAGMQIKIL
jgi:hypothetical protein